MFSDVLMSKRNLAQPQETHKEHVNLQYLMESSCAVPGVFHPILSPKMTPGRALGEGHHRSCQLSD